MVEWRRSEGLTAYAAAELAQEARAAAIADGDAPELVWLLEHPPLYTAGPRAKPQDLLQPDRFPVHYTRRGGEFTYHGPGQRVAYVLLNLNARRRDLRAFVWSLEEWIIRALSDFEITGERREGRVGVWVRRTGPNSADREDKVAALGVRLRRWVSFHGVAINVNPDLSHFDGVTPCGIREHGVTSLRDLGVDATLPALDTALARWFDPVFNAFAAKSAIVSPAQTTAGVDDVFLRR